MYEPIIYTFHERECKFFLSLVELDKNSQIKAIAAYIADTVYKNSEVAHQISDMIGSEIIKPQKFDVSN